MYTHSPFVPKVTLGRFVAAGLSPLTATVTMCPAEDPVLGVTFPTQKLLSMTPSQRSATSPRIASPTFATYTLSVYFPEARAGKVKETLVAVAVTGVTSVSPRNTFAPVRLTPVSETASPA